MDILFIVLTVAFFLLTAGVAVFFDRLKGA
jgi:hypothetical protein